MSERSLPRRLRDALLRWSGLPYLYRELAQRRGFTVVYYHHIEPQTLDRHLDMLGRRYALVSLRECVDALEAGRLDDLPPKSLVVTLDDGLASNRELLEVFRAHRVTPTIFLCSGIIGTRRRVWTAAPALSRADVERLKSVPDDDRVAALEAVGHTDTTEYPEPMHLSRAEIEEMRESVDFQSHTVFHPILPRCSGERAEREIRECREQLAAAYEFDVYALAYPDGAFGGREADLARDAGYRCAVTTAPGVNRRTADPMRLARIYLPEVEDENAVLLAASVWPLALRAGLERRLRRS